MTNKMKTAQVFDIQDMPDSFNKYLFEYYDHRYSNDCWVKWYWEEKNIEHPDWNNPDIYYEFQNWMVENGAKPDEFTLIKYWW